jgi:hypothetical protein
MFTCLIRTPETGAVRPGDHVVEQHPLDRLPRVWPAERDVGALGSGLGVLIDDETFKIRPMSPPPVPAW